MNQALRKLVRNRAGNRCEYCRLPQNALPFAIFHVEHIVARQHGGDDIAENLALACDRCNAFKGTNLTTIDPQTNQGTHLFNPRTQDWLEHFKQHDFEIVGMTAIGRATVHLLNMIAPRRIQLRRSLQLTLE